MNQAARRIGDSLDERIEAKRRLRRAAAEQLTRLDLEIEELEYQQKRAMLRESFRVLNSDQPALKMEIVDDEIIDCSYSETGREDTPSIH